MKIIVRYIVIPYKLPISIFLEKLKCKIHCNTKKFLEKKIAIADECEYVNIASMIIS